MKPLIIILYGLIAPGSQPEPVAVWWGAGAYEACIEALPDAAAWAKTEWPGARFWCAPMASDLAPVRSIIPMPRPDRTVKEGRAHE